MMYPADDRPLSSPSPLPSFLTALLFVVVLGGCEAGFDPIATSDDAFYALHGVLDTGADTQFVRVSPVRATSAAPTPPLDAEVRATVEGTGRRLAWQDSLTTLADGTTGFLFFTTDPVVQGETYVLTVRRSDGAETRARLALPIRRTLTPTDLNETFSGRLQQYVIWQGLDAAPRQATMHYLVQEPGTEAPQWIALPVENGGRRVPTGWELRVELSVDRALLLQERLGRSSTDSTVVLRGLRMSIEERTDAWRLADPSSRIENGFGFFGGIVRHEDAWTLPPDAIEALGFAAPDDGQGTVPFSF
jgi:hypothetical protein